MFSASPKGLQSRLCAAPDVVRGGGESGADMRNLPRDRTTLPDCRRVPGHAGEADIVGVQPDHPISERFIAVSPVA